MRSTTRFLRLLHKEQMHQVSGTRSLRNTRGTEGMVSGARSRLATFHQIGQLAHPPIMVLCMALFPYGKGGGEPGSESPQKIIFSKHDGMQHETYCFFIFIFYCWILKLGWSSQCFNLGVYCIQCQFGWGCLFATLEDPSPTLACCFGRTGSTKSTECKQAGILLGISAGISSVQLLEEILQVMDFVNNGPIKYKKWVQHLGLYNQIAISATKVNYGQHVLFFFPFFLVLVRAAPTFVSGCCGLWNIMMELRVDFLLFSWALGGWGWWLAKAFPVTCTSNS